MTKQERKKIAKQIADLELGMKNNPSREYVESAEAEIERLCNNVSSLIDMMAIDDEIQRIIGKQS